MGNLNSIKILIKKYDETKSKRFAEMLVLSLSYNLPDMNIYLILSKEEKNVIKEACDNLNSKQIKKVI